MKRIRAHILLLVLCVACAASAVAVAKSRSPAAKPPRAAKSVVVPPTLPDRNPLRAAAPALRSRSQCRHKRWHPRKPRRRTHRRRILRHDGIGCHDRDGNGSHARPEPHRDPGRCASPSRPQSCVLIGGDDAARPARADGHAADATWRRRSRSCPFPTAIRKRRLCSRRRLRPCHLQPRRRRKSSPTCRRPIPIPIAAAALPFAMKGTLTPAIAAPPPAMDYADDLEADPRLRPLGVRRGEYQGSAALRRGRGGEDQGSGGPRFRSLVQISQQPGDLGKRRGHRAVPPRPSGLAGRRTSCARRRRRCCSSPMPAPTRSGRSSSNSAPLTGAGKAALAGVNLKDGDEARRQGARRLGVARPSAQCRGGEEDPRSLRQYAHAPTFTARASTGCSIPTMRPRPRRRCACRSCCPPTSRRRSPRASPW